MTATNGANGVIQRLPLLRLPLLLVRRGGPYRLWIVEKPFWQLGRQSAILWRWGAYIWVGIIRFLNRDAASLAVLAGYALGSVVFLSRWPVTRGLLRIHRTTDLMLLAVAALWALMLVAWVHQQVQEQLLRWAPALLSIPLWLPPLLVLFALLIIASALMLAASIVVTPLGCLAMAAGIVYSWWRWRHGITVRCTKGECFSRNRSFRDLEIRYVCPGNCGGRYPFLVPSHLGLVSHQCTCGARLPALNSLRRRMNKDGEIVERTLHKDCPHGHPWGIATDPLLAHFIALVGGSSAGKTCYLTMAAEGLRDGTTGARRIRAAFESKSHETDHLDKLDVLRKGGLPEPTRVGVPDAVVLRLRGQGSKESRLYFYDAAGEEYTRLNRGPKEEFEFFEDLTGVVLLIDPLCLPLVRSQLADEVESLRGSETPLEHVIASLRRNVNRFLRYGRSGRSEIPVAAVLSKADAPVIGDRVGTVAVQRAAGAARPSTADAGGIEHQMCRQALLDWGAENEVAALEDDFPRVRYFSCSSLGRTPDDTGRPFVPDRVLPPLLWLLSGAE
jgi:hypothetical protein